MSDVERHLALVAGMLGGATASTCAARARSGPVSPVVFVNLVEGISQTEQLAHRCRRGPLALELQLPLPPARHGGAPPRRRPAGPRLRGARRTSTAPSPSREFHLYVHDADHGWKATHDFALTGPGDLMPSPLARAKAALAEPARESPPGSTTWSATQEHYGRVNGAAAGRRRAPTTRSSPSSRSWRSRSSSVGYVAQVYPHAQDNLVSGIDEVLPGDRRRPSPGADHRSAPSRTPPPPSGSRPARPALRRPGLAVGHADRPPDRVRDAPQPAPELRDRQAARPGLARSSSASVLMLSVAVTGVVVGFSDQAARPGRTRAPSSPGWSRCSAIVVGMRRQHAAVLRVLPAAGAAAGAAPGAVAGRAAGRRRRSRSSSRPRATC